MGVLETTITYTGLPKLTRKTMRAAQKKSMEAVGWTWDGKFKPIHFTSAGARRYHFAKRWTKEITSGKIKTTRLGKKRAPDARPLVWSGTSLRAAQSKSIKAKSTRVRVTYQGIRVFNFPTKNPAINMREEFKAYTRAEEKNLNKVARDRITTILRRTNTKVRVAITN